MARVGISGADHALACALFAVLRPGDTLLVATGGPSQSRECLTSDHAGGLGHWGVRVRNAAAMRSDGSLDVDQLLQQADAHWPAAMLVQRCVQPLSALRGAGGVVPLAELARLAAAIAETVPDCVLVVDNAGAELLEASEPSAIPGVALVTGALSGQLGGGIVAVGGYAAGKAALVERACARMSAPGLSLDAGSVSGDEAAAALPRCAPPSCRSKDQQRLIHDGLVRKGEPSVVHMPLLGGNLRARRRWDQFGSRTQLTCRAQPRPSRGG